MAECLLRLRTGSLAVFVLISGCNGSVFDPLVEPSTASPLVPTALSAIPFSSTRIDLAWNGSPNSAGVTRYLIYRDSVPVGTSASTSYSDSGLAPSTTYTYAVAAVDAVGNTSGLSPSATATTPAQFSGGWTALPNTKLMSVCPPLFSYCQPVIGAWSGGIADTLRNRLVLWGGGHGDYSGNEVYALNLAGSPATLVRLTNPSPPNPDPSNCPTTLSDGNPNSRHTYNGLAYLPTVDKMLAFGGSLACGNGTHLEDMWTLDLSSLQWTRMDPVNGAAGHQPKDYYTPVPNILVYDPNTQVVFLSDTDSLWKYDIPTNSYTLLNLSAGIPYASTGVVDPNRKLIIFMGSGQVAAVDIASGSSYQVQNWTAQVAGCGGLMGANYPGWAYDSALDRMVGWPNFGDTVYVFDPDTKICVAQTFPGGPRDSTDYNGNRYSTGTFGRLQYFPGLDEFALVNFWTNDAYVLKLSP